MLGASHKAVGSTQHAFSSASALPGAKLPGVTTLGIFEKPSESRRLVSSVPGSVFQVPSCLL